MPLEFTECKLVQACVPEITEKQWLFLIIYLLSPYILGTQL